MLATDYVLQGAVTALEKVRDGQLRLDRTIEVSVTNTAEKTQHHAAAGPESEDAAAPAATQQPPTFGSRSAAGRSAGSAGPPGDGWFAAATRRCDWSRS